LSRCSWTGCAPAKTTSRKGVAAVSAAVWRDFGRYTEGRDVFKKPASIPLPVHCDVGHSHALPRPATICRLDSLCRHALPPRLTHATIRFLDWIAHRALPSGDSSPPLRTGRQGEEDAYFYLRWLG
jgi:hypothetical protein